MRHSQGQLAVVVVSVVLASVVTGLAGCGKPGPDVG